MLRRKIETGAFLFKRMPRQKKEKTKKGKQHHSKETTQQSAEWRCIWMRGGLHFLLFPTFLLVICLYYTPRDAVVHSVVPLSKKKRGGWCSDRKRQVGAVTAIYNSTSRVQTNCEAKNVYPTWWLRRELQGGIGYLCHWLESGDVHYFFTALFNITGWQESFRYILRASLISIFIFMMGRMTMWKMCVYVCNQQGIVKWLCRSPLLCLTV